jgi:hypothetical protein
MAREIRILVMCDRCGADANNAHHGLRFAYRGVDYVIDLCDACGKELDTAMSTYTAVAERAEARARRHAREKRTVGVPYLDSVRAGNNRLAERQHRDAVRTWARVNGWPTIGDRGRVPTAATEAFTKAHA